MCCGQGAVILARFSCSTDCTHMKYRVPASVATSIQYAIDASEGTELTVSQETCGQGDGHTQSTTLSPLVKCRPPCDSDNNHVCQNQATTGHSRDYKIQELLPLILTGTEGLLTSDGIHIEVS